MKTDCAGEGRGNTAAAAAARRRMPPWALEMFSGLRIPLPNEAPE